MTSLQTTIAGIVVIIAAIVLLVLAPTAANTAISASLIAAGLGLIGTRGNKTSDEQAGAGQKPIEPYVPGSVPDIPHPIPPPPIRPPLA